MPLELNGFYLIFDQTSHNHTRRFLSAVISMAFFKDVLKEYCFPPGHAYFFNTPGVSLFSRSGRSPTWSRLRRTRQRSRWYRICYVVLTKKLQMAVLSFNFDQSCRHPI